MKIFILNGHPYSKGLASKLAAAYEKGARKKGFEVRRTDLVNLDFDPILRYGYRKEMELESDLVTQQENIKWCDHLVIAMPVWWMGMPALLKGFFDRAILPRFAYSYGNRKLIPKGLLKGKSVTVIYTQGAPRWATALAFFDAHWLVIKFGVLRFVGLGPVKRFVVGRADKISEEKIEKITQKVYQLGTKGK